MMKHTAISLVIALSISACGGSQSATTGAASTTTTQASAGGEHHEGGGHHPRLSPALHAMHEVLAPLWHSEPSPARDARTCEQAATLRERAGAAQAETPPADAPPNAAEARAQLVVASDALVAECAGSRANVAAKLADLHTAFHRTFEGH